MANRPSRRLDKRPSSAPHPEVPAQRASKGEAPTYLFRIHFKDGTTQDVRAETAATARECARPGEIAKVKIIRETN